MSNIQLQNSNLNGGLSNREIELQASISSQNTLQASMVSHGDLHASIGSLEVLYASMASQGALKGSVTKDVVLKGIVVKPATLEVYHVDENLSLDSVNPVQNKVVTETMVLLYYALDNKADNSDIPIKVSQLANDVGYLTEHQDLSNYAKLVDIPVNISAFVNDTGYLIQHQDLSEYAKKIEIPVNVSQLLNDAGYLTEHQDLSEYAKIIHLPTKVSQLANDTGYLTEHQDLSAYAKFSDLPTKVSHLTNDVGYLTEHQDLSEYVRITDLPTKVSHFINDVGYLTEHQDLSAYAKLSDIPIKVSQLANDSGYLTEHQSLDDYYTKVEITTELNKKQDVITQYASSVNGYSGVVNLTASDVRALPDTTVIPTIPTVVSAFVNDADYASKTYVTEVAAGKCKAYTFGTIDELDKWLAVETNVSDLNNGDVFYIRAVGVPDYWWDSQTNSKQILETTKVDLTDYAKTIDVPTKVSQLTNDADFITVAEVDTKLGNKQDKITSYVSSVNGKSGDISLTCTDIGAMPSDTVIPTVPTKVSAFTNDAGYLTQHQSLAGYAKSTDIPTKVSQLTNDAGYLTQHQSLANYATVATVNALTTRIAALEAALGGFSFVGSTSAPTSAGANTITFVNAG